jgi:hypothetical protein
MIRAPDFGRILTKDRFYPNPIPMPTLDLNPYYANRNLPSISTRFDRIMRYLARGPIHEAAVLTEDPRAGNPYPTKP